MVNSNPARSGCAGDVPQSIAVAKDGAEIHAPCTINLGRQAARAPLPTAFRDEPLWDTQRTVCAASGFENPCDFLLNLRETPPLLEDMRGKGISGQRFSEKDRNSEDWHGTESRGYIGTTATTHLRTMALGRTSGAFRPRHTEIRPVPANASKA